MALYSRGLTSNRTPPLSVFSARTVSLTAPVPTPCLVRVGAKWDDCAAMCVIRVVHDYNVVVLTLADIGRAVRSTRQIARSGRASDRIPDAILRLFLRQVFEPVRVL